MNERDLEKACATELVKQLPRCLVWKIHDEVTAGQPDLEVSWNGATTKLEFKLLKKGETVHDKWEDPRQLLTCVRYEQATSRCWVIAWFRGWLGQRPAETLIYRPTALLHGKLPTTDGWDQDNSFRFQILWERGMIRLRGIDHVNVANLIRYTHR